ncbi:hypothetical protein CBX60_14735 [Salmonella enterica subsp. enterica serovar Pensacola]|nr:hypothetical protein [Salmonella enterica]ECT8865857.1 hypothetical protein [Salmonella enterica subsp. enterica serovar Pensacola]
MKQTMTRAAVGLLLGHAACSTAEMITVPTPDLSAEVLHADFSHLGADDETYQLVGSLKQVRGDRSFYKQIRDLDGINYDGKWAEAGFTNGASIEEYVGALYSQISQAAVKVSLTCQTTPGCNGEDVRKNLQALLSETQKVQALYTAVTRIGDLMTRPTPQSPLTSASNINANDVTDNRTYKIKAADNEELTPRNGVLLPAQTGIPNTLITVPQFTVNYNGTKNKPIISLEGVETVDSMTTDSHKALVTDVGADNTFRLQPGKSSVLAVGNNNNTTGPDALSVGTGNTSENSLVIGTRSDGTDQSITIGTSSHAEKQSIAIGTGTTAREGSVAIGNGSEATSENELSIGNAKNGLTRTITNMKDGVADTDGATVNNVKEAIKAARSYTNTEIGTLDTKAKGYASNAKDEAVSAANKHTNTEITTLDGKARGYASDALKKANEHTERRAVVAENNAVTRSNAYTDESSSRTLDKANTYTNHRAAQAENNAVARSNAYTNKRFGELKNQVDRNEKRANGGIAGAMAMSTITGSGSGFGMALSGYRDQSAIAAGIQKSITPNTTVNVKVAWDSGNGVGAAAGFFTSW